MTCVDISAIAVRHMHPDPVAVDIPVITAATVAIATAKTALMAHRLCYSTFTTSRYGSRHRHWSPSRYASPRSGVNGA